MIRGDLVHIPQGTLLLKEKDRTIFNEAGYIRAKKPLRALFWDFDSKEPTWGSVYYKEQVWSVRMRDIYPITQEVENAC